MTEQNKGIEQNKVVEPDNVDYNPSTIRSAINTLQVLVETGDNMLEDTKTLTDLIKPYPPDEPQKSNEVVNGVDILSQLVLLIEDMGRNNSKAIEINNHLKKIL